jgi:hypothetical protein
VSTPPRAGRSVETEEAPLDPDVKDKIVAQLGDAEDRFAAILR